VEEMIMKRSMMLITGLLLCMISLWGGAYMVNILGDNHWAIFPITVTAIVAFFIGAVYVLEGLPLKG
jgi:hypothetical protein